MVGSKTSILSTFSTSSISMNESKNAIENSENLRKSKIGCRIPKDVSVKYLVSYLF